jgi:DNA-binding ferritin-like protein
MMNSQELKQSIDKIEECADQAERAVQAGSAPGDLRQCVEQLHQQAKQAKQAGADEASMRQQVMQMEQTADRAKQACSSAGGQVDQKTQQAVMQAHDEVSKLKKQLQQG